MKNIRILTIVLFVLIINLVTAYAQIINIPDDFETIQAGLNNMGNEDTLIVHPGTYEEHDLQVGGNTKTIASRFLLTGDPEDISSTIIDAQRRGCVMTLGSSNSLLCGFTLVNGVNENGGGLVITGGFSAISNMIIRDCEATEYGGGIYTERTENNIVEDMEIYHCHAESGGGFFSGMFTEISVINCHFHHNEADLFGGGMYDLQRGDLTVQSTLIEGNSAGQGGGFAATCGATITMIDSNIKDNLAIVAGGGVHISGESTLFCGHTLIQNNSSENRGGGIYIEGAVERILSFVTVVENESEIGGGAYLFNCTDTRIENSIFWYNEPQSVFANDNSEVEISFTDIEGGQEGNPGLTWRNGNIYDPPLFIAPHNRYYYLREDSPCIDAGDPEAEDDPDNTRADMGAFYYQSYYDERDENPHRFDVPDEFETIQLAIVWAQNGDTVLVAPGEYLENNIYLEGKDILVTSHYIFDQNHEFVEQTIIDGQERGSIFLAVDGEQDAAIHGFTIRNGLAENGGGIQVIEGSASIIANIFEGNQAEENGGAVYCESSSSTISDNTFLNNSAQSGAGVNVHLGNTAIASNSFTNNVSEHFGGGIYCSEAQFRFSMNTFSNNQCGNHGGGVFIAGSNNGGYREMGEIENEVISNTFVNNSADQYGGGLYCRYDAVELTNNSIRENRCDRIGGGVFLNRSLAIVKHNLIVGNSGESGGGIGIRRAFLEFYNNTVCQNEAESGSGFHTDNIESTIYFTNNILWDNAGIEIFSESEMNVSYSDIQDGEDGIEGEIEFGEGCIDADPLFYNSEAGNFQLTVNSPCIDAGDPEAEEDSDGTRSDMGAYFFDQVLRNRLQHFNNFTETEIQSQVNIVELDLDGQVPPYGWEIGFFTRDDILAGAGIWDGEGSECYIYGDNPETEQIEGFLTHEWIMNIYVWDSENDVEYRAGNQPQDNRRGGYFFNVERDRDLHLYVDPDFRDHTLELTEGWNLVSLNVHPAEEFYDHDEEHPSFRIIIDQLRNDYENDGPFHHLILAKDQEGQFYAPVWEWCLIPGWFYNQGYQILVDRDIKVHCWGMPVDPQADIHLRENWNMISYLPDYELDAGAPDFHVVSDVIENIVVAKNCDGQFLYPEFNFSNMPPWSPGQGYQVKTTAECVLNYPEEREEVLASSRFGAKPKPIHWTFTQQTGSNMSVLIVLDNQSLPADCEIAAINADGQLLGSGVINIDNYCGLAVWGDDESTEDIEGLRDGEAFSLMLWNAQDGMEQELHVHNVLVGEGLIYGKDALTVIEAATEAEMPTQFSLQSAYPNPFNSMTRITYALPDVAQIDISVYDIQGRLVKSLFNGMQQAGYQSLVWDADGVSSGIYFVRLSDGQTSLSRKVLLAR